MSTGTSCIPNYVSWVPIARICRVEKGALALSVLWLSQLSPRPFATRFRVSIFDGTTIRRHVLDPSLGCHKFSLIPRSQNQILVLYNLEAISHTREPRFQDDRHPRPTEPVRGIGNLEGPPSPLIFDSYD
ncbi:hypothetical protein N658DRAFT_500941 [Parathielavia hyrcaniae]|uniref:Uncharacterized protein n=1 Tax=Parathielavia hyrcaniae TaxID=113614 RepID=A0AAN6PSM5_9PEZI|nr:hypothetical protein N658DRAFT_500941 [Parathielavia hyrcaniae]